MSGPHAKRMKQTLKNMGKMFKRNTFYFKDKKADKSYGTIQDFMIWRWETKKIICKKAKRSKSTHVGGLKIS